jgi:hypothetical protein
LKVARRKATSASHVERPYDWMVTMFGASSNHGLDIGILRRLTLPPLMATDHRRPRPRRSSSPLSRFRT